jgi:hypothetical protein
MWLHSQIRSVLTLGSAADDRRGNSCDLSPNYLETFRKLVLTERGLAGDPEVAAEWLYKHVPEWKATIDALRA